MSDYFSFCDTGGCWQWELRSNILFMQSEDILIVVLYFMEVLQKVNLISTTYYEVNFM